MANKDKRISETDIRLLGLEYAVDESVPQVVGVLVFHLARTGVLDLDAFAQEIRDCHDPDLRREDSTGVLLSTLGDIVDAYRKDREPPARREAVLEKVIGR